MMATTRRLFILTSIKLTTEGVTLQNCLHNNKSSTEQHDNSSTTNPFTHNDGAIDSNRQRIDMRQRGRSKVTRKVSETCVNKATANQ
jgi:hypothetical protein